ncbi:MAG TPA: hypothetical protein VFA90_19050 [Terriglobales bacterium]|nr:hypothetical protein [Terriglobales bacterium]
MSRETAGVAEGNRRPSGSRMREKGSESQDEEEYATSGEELGEEDIGVGATIYKEDLEEESEARRVQASACTEHRQRRESQAEAAAKNRKNLQLQQHLHVSGAKQHGVADPAARSLRLVRAAEARVPLVAAVLENARRRTSVAPLGSSQISFECGDHGGASAGKLAWIGSHCVCS